MNNSSTVPQRRPQSAKDVKLTIAACYSASFTQAAVANLPPLFYALYNEELGIPLGLIALIPTLFFGLQIATDAVFSVIVAKIGYRATAVIANALSASGLIILGFSPLFPSAIAAIFVSTFLCAIGSGIIEITTSPLVEALPGDGKSAAMSLLHSFYCWGYLAVVLSTTLFFALFGKTNWHVLPFFFALIPITCSILFLCIGRLNTLEDNGCSKRFSEFGKNSIFLILFLLMICAGAGEQVIAQWASFFAEKGLGVSKATGDLLGTSAFALCMALSRTFYGVKGKKIPLSKTLVVCSGALAFSYLLTALSPIPALSLIGVALCGLSVGIMWPGTLALAGESRLGGGTLMFAILALAGDVGATLAPSVAGEVSALTNVSTGILTGTIFPVASLILLMLYAKSIKAKNSVPNIEK